MARAGAYGASSVAPPPLSALLWRNTSIQMVAYAVSLAIGLATAIVLSRHLGVEGFAEFNYVFAFIYFFLALNDFGVSVIVVREVSQDRARAGEIIGSILAFKLALAALSLLAAWTVIWAMDFQPPLRSALGLYALVLPLAAWQLPGVIFQVVGRLEYPAMIGAASRCVGFMLMLGAVWAGYGVLAMVAALVLAEAASLTVVLTCSKRYVRPVWRIDPALWRRVLRSSVPLGLAGLFAAVVNRVDFLMLERLTDLTQVGLYAAAYKVTSLLETLPLMVMATVYPLMSRYAAEDPERLRALFRKSALLLGLVGVPLGIVVTVAAPLIVRVLFGAGFGDAAPALEVLVWGTTCLYLAISGGNLLISMGRERLNLAILAFGALVNITLNLLWIPSAGLLGAAWATTTTFFVILLGTAAAAWSCLRPGAPRGHERFTALPAALPREP
jgi:O-antigen/teichoic acid export membrane protein